MRLPRIFRTTPFRLTLLFLALWQLHYVHRTFVFPFRMRASERRMPLAIPLLGMRYSTPLKAIRGVVPSPLEWPPGVTARASAGTSIGDIRFHTSDTSVLYGNVANGIKSVLGIDHTAAPPCCLVCK